MQITQYKTEALVEQLAEEIVKLHDQIEELKCRPGGEEYEKALDRFTQLSAQLR